MVRLAVIGLGYWGPNLVRNFRSVDECHLSTICDRDPSRTGQIAKAYPELTVQHDVEDVLRDDEIDAVVIATPISTHYPLAKAALEAGKSVLVEKPLTANLSQAQELVELANRRGLTLMVDHVFIYSAPVRKMKEIVDSGRLGSLLFLDSVRINLGLVQEDVNVLWDLGPHDVSITDYLIGRLPKSVSAFGASHTSSGTEDVAYMNLDYGDGLIANFHVNWLSPVKVRYTMVGGSDQSLIYNDLDPSETVKVYDRGVTESVATQQQDKRILIDYRKGDVWSPHLDLVEPLRRMATHFVECVRDGRPSLTDGAAGSRVVRILEAADRSIKAQGGRVTL